MNTDFRVSVDFFTHHKTLKLQRRLGPEGVLCLLKLWAYASKSRSDGVLTGMDSEDIEIAAGWSGDEGEFVGGILGMFLEETDGTYALHDWQDHNPWAAAADERSEKGRFARLKKVRPSIYEELLKVGVSKLTKDEYNTLTTVEGDLEVTLSGPRGDLKVTLSNLQGHDKPRAQSPTPAPTPTPAPAPSPTPEELPPFGGSSESPPGNSDASAQGRLPGLPESAWRHTPGDGEPCAGNGGSDKNGKKQPPPCPHEAIKALYHEILPQLPKVQVWDQSRKEFLTTRWREDKARQNLDWWRDYFQRVAASDFLTGKIARRNGKIFRADLEWLVRPSNLGKVLNGRYDNGPQRDLQQGPPQPRTYRECQDAEERLRNERLLAAMRGDNNADTGTRGAGVGQTRGALPRANE